MLDPIKVREALDYNELTGEMIWKVRPRSHFNSDRGCNIFNTSHSGTVAGTTGNHGYRQVNLFGKIYLVHRVIMLMKNSEMPEHDVDHINGNRVDNRLCNLRLATRRENLKNRMLSTKNSSGINGVSWDKRYKNWTARIRIEGKYLYIGNFENKEDAALARYIFDMICYYDPSHGRR